MSLLARSKPYPSKPRGTYQCARCGIINNVSAATRHNTHCKDCKPYALKDK